MEGLTREQSRALTVHGFVEVFKTILYVAPAGLDRFESDGMDLLAQQLLYFINKNEPIKLILLAFPCKSANNDRVLGSAPDRGEELALKRLDGFCDQISPSVYPPGCKLVIMTDGRVYGDLVGVSDDSVAAYRETLKKLVPLKNVEFHSLDDHFSTETKDSGSLGSSGPDEAVGAKVTDGQSEVTSGHFGTKSHGDRLRELLVASSGVTEAEVKAQIGPDGKYRNVFEGFRKLLEYDLKFEDSVSEADRKAKIEGIAVKMMVRNFAYTELVEKKYPNRIRLSIHDHDNAGPKFGIVLLEGNLN